MEAREEQTERKREEKERTRGPEGQRPLIPVKVCVDKEKRETVFLLL